YGGFLMRYCDDAEIALEQFEFAKALDPVAFEIDRDMAWACLFLKDFERASVILEGLVVRKDINERNRIILFALRLQFYKRKGEFLIDINDYREAIDVFYEMITLYKAEDEYLKDLKNKNTMLEVRPR